MKNKKYYLIKTTTIYDGLEFSDNMAITRDYIFTNKEAEKLAEDCILHTDTGEILDRVELIEITKTEYEVLRKFHI